MCQYWIRIETMPTASFQFWYSTGTFWHVYRHPLASSLNAHYSDVIMSTVESQITCLRIVYSAVYSGANRRKHQSSALLAFVRGIHRSPVHSPHKGPVARKMFPFHDVIMPTLNWKPRTTSWNNSLIYPTDDVFFCVSLTNCWTHSRVAGYLRYYDVHVRS